MKKLLHLLKVILLFVQIPLALSNGSKRRMYVEIKKRMVSLNLF